MRSAISGLSHASFVRRSSLKCTLECLVAPHPMRSLRWSRCWQPSGTTAATPQSEVDNTQTWKGELYSPEQFRGDAGVLDGVSLVSDGSVSDMLWVQPAVTILEIDCPPVLGSTAAIVPRAAARLNLRIPPGMAPDQARDALVDHLRAVAPWGVQVAIEVEAEGAPFRAATNGPAYDAISAAMEEAFGTPMTALGQGGSIPLCNVFAETYPAAELIMMGVEEPQALIHAPNESVAPSEIQSMALTEALFMQRYPTARGR